MFEITTTEMTMSSIDLLNLINLLRREAGETEVRRNDFTARCADELDGEHYESFVVTNSNGTQSEALLLTLDQCSLIGMRESKSVRRNLLAKIKELEAQAKKPAFTLPDFTNPAIAARAWADAIEQKQAAEEKAIELIQKLAVAAPKADALDLISASDEAVTMTEAAKVLGIKRDKLTTWMNANGWIYRQNGRWVAYHQHIVNGRLQYKEATYTDQNTGLECRAPYCHILPKGMAKLALVFSGPVWQSSGSPHAAANNPQLG